MAVVVAAIVVILIATGGGSKKGIPKTAQAKNQTVAEVTSLVSGIPQNGNVLGNPNAPVTLQYFGDLECPICQEFTLGALPSIVQQWVRTGKLKIEYRALETATHEPEVFKTQQVAALAAGKQNKMWDFIELFYHEQGEEDSGYVTESYLQDLAQQVPGLNLTKWTSDRNDPALASEVTSDAEAANNAGLHGHPVVPARQDRGTLHPSTGHLHRSRRPTTPKSKNSSRASSADEQSNPEAHDDRADGDRPGCGQLSHLRPLLGRHADLLDQGQPLQPGAEIGVLEARRRSGGPDRPDRLHRDSRLAARSRRREDQVR